MHPRPERTPFATLRPSVALLGALIPMHVAIMGIQACGDDADGDGFSIDQGDCNDDDAAVYPGAPELCNALDENCDGQADEEVDCAPVIISIAGIGAPGYSGDGGAATNARLNHVADVAVDADGTVYIADKDNNRIRKIALDGVISTVAGIGTTGFSGDGGPATAAELYQPYGIALDGVGNLFIADTNNQRIRRVNLIDGQIDTVVGSGTAGFSGDGGSALSAQLSYPGGVDIDDAGTLYIADTRNCRIRKVSTTGIISSVAGTNICGFSGDSGPATSARLNNPLSVSWFSGALYVSDGYDHRVRFINPAGTIITVAGNGSAGYSGDGGLASSAQLSYPGGVTVDPVGDLYIADSFNNVIRKVSAVDNVITTLAGTGVAGFGGDNGLAAAAQLYDPYGIALDDSGNIYVADTFNDRIRKILP